MYHYPDSMEKSRQLFEQAQRVMPGGNTRNTVYMDPYPIYMASGQGCKVTDVDGNSYYDCINNFTSLIHGHSHPDIVQASLDQAPRGISFGAPTPSEIELADILVQRLPAVEHVRFTNSGTEAVMMAIKAARAHTQRPRIVKIEGSYHGSYDFAEISLDSSPDNWGDTPQATPYARGTPEGVLDDVLVVPFNDPGALERVFSSYGDTIAAILIDPMPNRVGLIPPHPDYLKQVVDVAHQHGALAIFDEVISFRLGHSGAQGLWGARPDLTALGKIIGGGYPVGAVGGRADVMAVFDPTGGKPALPHGGTFTANPMTMRAGIASMQLLTPQAYEHLDAIGDNLRTRVTELLRKHGLDGHCVGKGSLMKIHFTAGEATDYRSIYPGPRERAMLNRLFLGLINRGVIIAPYGLFALSTPMQESDIEYIAGAMDSIFGEQGFKG